jgi:hypothetical protein
MLTQAFTPGRHLEYKHNSASCETTTIHVISKLNLSQIRNHTFPCFKTANENNWTHTEKDEGKLL